MQSHVSRRRERSHLGKGQGSHPAGREPMRAKRKSKQAQANQYFRKSQEESNSQPSNVVLPSVAVGRQPDADQKSDEPGNEQGGCRKQQRVAEPHTYQGPDWTVVDEGEPEFSASYGT